MASISFDRFDGGLDLRRGPSVSDANRMRVCTNAHVTNGKGLQKRPCLRKIALLEFGTNGLRSGNGVLNTFYGSGTITHANALFKANLVQHPTAVQAVSKVHFGEVFNGYLYASIEYADGSIKHHYLDGTSPTHVVDVNCPNSKEVIKQQSKIYAKGNEVVRFSATNAPRNWTAASDAGFLPTGIQAEGSTSVTALGQFGQKKLVVFMVDGIQVWSVDPNPSLNALNNIIQNIGTRHSKSPLGFSGDIFFLSENGFRSLTVSQLTDNFNDVDIGSAIDSLVKPSVAATDNPESVFYSGLGQFWSINGKDVWVYSFSRTAKISAWSRFTIPVTADAIAVLNGDMYVRNGNDVYIVDRNIYSDDGAVPTVTIEFPYLDFKTPGVLKQIFAVDSVGSGTPSLQLKWMGLVNGVVTEFITSPVPIISNNTSIPGPLTPVELCATAVAPLITHAANEDFRLDSLTFYYENLSYNT